MKGLFGQGKKETKPTEKPKDQKPLEKPKIDEKKKEEKVDEKKVVVTKPIDEKKNLNLKEEPKNPQIHVEKTPEENKRSSIEDDLNDLMKEIKKDTNVTNITSPRDFQSPRDDPKSPRNEKKSQFKVERPEEETLQKELRAELRKSDKKLDIQALNEPLFLAIHDENLTEMEDLISKDSSLVNKVYEDGITPLMFASLRNFIPGIELLIKNEAKIEAQATHTGLSALHYAIYRGNREAVHVLLENGAKAKEKGGYTPLMGALFKKHKIIAYDLLLYGQNINDKNENGMTALHIATIRKDIDSLNFLIENGANVNIKDSNGNTPLFLAVQTNNRDAIKRFVEISECDWTIKNNRGQTLFHYAILTKNATLVDFLYSIKKDSMTKLINEIDNIQGRTPIFYSVAEYDKILSFLIIQPQVNLNIQDQAGDTVLHVAIKIENVNAIRLLMNGPNAANSEIKNLEKQSAKMLLKSKPELKSKLNDKGGKGFASGDVEL